MVPFSRSVTPWLDHLAYGTYEVFEKDPIKYLQYRAACAAAYRDPLLAGASVCHVVVAGAGRRPLVTAALEAWHAHVGPLRMVGMRMVWWRPSEEERPRVW